MKTVSTITVKNVRIGDAVQSIRFAHRPELAQFYARTRGHTAIRVRFVDGKFVAGNRSYSVAAKTSDHAFAKAVKECWAN